MQRTSKTILTATILLFLAFSLTGCFEFIAPKSKTETVYIKSKCQKYYKLPHIKTYYITDYGDINATHYYVAKEQLEKARDNCSQKTRKIYLYEKMIDNNTK